MDVGGLGRGCGRHGGGVQLPEGGCKINSLVIDSIRLPVLYSHLLYVRVV